MVERFERFSYAIAEISRHWHKITAEEMEAFGLKGPHAIYLISMARHPEGVTAAQLCELSGKDKSDVSRMMATLEKKGFVTRESEHKNLYRGRFKLTEEGEKAAHQAQARASLAVEIAGSGLTDEQRRAMYEGLESIAEKLRDISRQGLPASSTGKE